MTLLNAIKSSLYLRNLFFSSGLYRAIPESMSDACFSLPYPVILWVYSWCDQNRQRGAQFRTSEFTRMCIQRCRATQTRMSMTHLALVWKCQPIKEWMQSLLEGNADFEQSLPLGPSPEHQGPPSPGHLTRDWSLTQHRACLVRLERQAIRAPFRNLPPFPLKHHSYWPCSAHAELFSTRWIAHLRKGSGVCIHYAKFLQYITTTQMWMVVLIRMYVIFSFMAVEHYGLLKKIPQIFRNPRAAIRLTLKRSGCFY